MRLLIVYPMQQEATGNNITAGRLQLGLQRLGLSVNLLAINPDETRVLTTEINRFRPDRLLLLHAWRSGLPWLSCSAADGIPTTVLLTGTDINHGINDPKQGPIIEDVLMKSVAIVSQNRLIIETLREQSPPWGDRLHYIQPGVLLGEAPYPLRKKHKISDHCRLFLHPAGIRPVKANLELLKLCDRLADRYPSFALAFCGPELDPNYFNKFIKAVNRRPWAHYLGTIPNEAMPSALADADLILNHSISEGMSNALIEAIAVDRPVLARNIPGNAALQSLSSHVTLYNSAQEFTTAAEQFLSAPPTLSDYLPEVENSLFTAATEAKNFAKLVNLTAA